MCDVVNLFSISLDALFHDGDIPAKSYNVMKDDAYCGEIRVGLNFTAQVHVVHYLQIL